MPTIETQASKTMSNQLPDELTRILSLRSMTALGMDWALIICCFVFAVYFPHPIVYLVAAIFIARTQLALAVLMHESAHGVLLPNRKLNDIIGQVFTAAPLMLSMYAYRRGHLQHHRAPMENDDPVATVFGIGDYPVPKRELIWRLVKDITSISYFLSIRDFVTGKHREVMAKSPAIPQAPRLVIASILIANGCMIGILAAIDHAGLYLGLWILPALTFLQFFARVRAITEHAGYPPGEDQIRNARTIVRPSWQTLFFGPHCIHYHIEHHQYVRAPFYHLPKIHQLMMHQGVIPPQNLYSGYGQVLKDVST